MEITREVHAVTCFLESEGEILLLLRSQNVSTYQDTWAGISGVIDRGRTADEQAMLEIEEETGLTASDIKLIKKGEPLTFDDHNFNVRKIVHPYLFHIDDRQKVRINWEHRQSVWIRPEDIDKYDTMPMLKETLERVMS